MSWEFSRCSTCGGVPDRTSVDTDAEGRIVVGFRCPADGTETTVPEPDDNFRSRMEAKEMGR